MSPNNSKAQRKGFGGGRRHEALERACRSAAPFDSRQWETFESRILFAIPVIKFTFDEPVITDPNGDQIVTNSGTSGAVQRGTLAGAQVLTAARDDSEADPAMRPLSPSGGGYLAMTAGTTHMDVGSAGDHNTWLDPILGSGSSSMAFWIRVRGQVGVGNAWQSPGVSGVEHNDGNDIFWGNLDPNSRLRLQPGDGTASVSTTPTSTFNPDTQVRDSAGWLHVVETRDVNTGIIRTYVNGKLENQSQGDVGPKTSWFRGIGATSLVDPDGRTVTGFISLDGDLDNVEVYNQVLDPVEIAQKYGPAAGAPPATPAGLTATTPAINAVRLVWNDVTGANGAIGYRILRSNNAGGPFTEVGVASQDGSSPTTLFNDRGLVAGTQYFYQVIAFNAAGQSAPATANATAVNVGNGITESYFNNPWWGATPGRPASVQTGVAVGTPQVQFASGDPIDYNWGSGSPAPGISGDNHSTVHTGQIVFDQAGDYLVLGFGDDDTAVFVNGGLASNDPQGHGPPGNDQGGIASIDAKNVITVGAAGSGAPFTVGVPYDLVVIQAEQGGGSAVTLRWIPPGGNQTTGPADLVPVDNLRSKMSIPVAPTNVLVDSNATATPTFTFTDNTRSELRYVLQRRLAGSPGAPWVTVRTAPMLAEATPDAAISGQTGTMKDTVTAAGTYEYRVGAENFDGAAYSAPVTVTVPAIQSGPGAEGYYFGTQFWGSTGRPADFNIVVGRSPDNFENAGAVGDNEDWGNGSPTGVPADNFSTAFTGKFVAPTTGTYRLAAFSDDDSYFWVNNQLVSADPGGHGIPGNDPGGIASIDVINPINLTAGQEYNFVAVQSEGGGGAGIILRVMPPGSTTFVDIPPEAYVSNIPNAAPDQPNGAPAAPSNVHVDDPERQDDNVVLRWNDNSANEMRQTVERTNLATNAVTLFDVGIGLNSFIDTGLTPNTAYRYRVFASNFQGESVSAAAFDVTTRTARTKPAAAGDVTVVTRNDRNRIGWADNSTNERQFIVQRKLSTDPDTAYAEIGRVNGNNAGAANGPNGAHFFFNDTTRTLGTAYSYRVIATSANAQGQGGENADPSPAVTVTSTAQGGNGMHAVYFDDRFFTGTTVVVENERAANMFGGGDVGFDGLDNGGGNNSPAGIGAETFSGAFQAELVPEFSEAYTFLTASDDGVALRIWDPATGQQLLNYDNIQALRGVGFGFQDNAGTLNLVKGKHYVVEGRFSENTGGAGYRFGWQSLHTPQEAFPNDLLFSTGTPVVKPGNVIIEPIANEEVRTTFTDIAFNETGYVVERANSAGGPYSPVGTLPANLLSGTQLSVSDRGPGLVLGNTYYYRVRATGTPADASSDPVAVTLAAGGTDITYGGSAKVLPGPDNNIATPADNQIQLTPATNGQTGTAFFTNARDVEAAGQGPAGSAGFTSSFDFVVPARSMNGDALNGADGFAFVIQRNNKLSAGGGGGALGAQGMPNSVALEFDFYQGGTGGLGADATNSTGLYLNGTDYISNDTVSTGSVETPFHFSNGHRYHVDLKYNEATDTLTETITDLDDNTAAPFTKDWTTATDSTNTGLPMDLSDLLGGKFAFVGFTGATGGLNADQRIQNWKFNGQDIPIVQAAQAQISDVYVRGSAWSTAFKSYLASKGLGDANYGYRLLSNGTPVPGPAADPDQILPWINLNEVVLKYATAPTGSGVPQVGTVAFTSQRGVTYTVTSVTPVAGDPTAFVVTLNQPLGGGNPTTGVAPTANENGDHVTLGVPGAGAGGGAFSLRMDVLQGDTDHTGESGTHSVLAADFSAVKKKFFKNTNDPVTGTDADYSVYHDVNGSGDILANDFSEVKKRFFQQMVAAPAAAASPFGVRRITREVLG